VSGIQDKTLLATSGGNPPDVAAAVESFRHVGATALSLRLVHHSPAHYVEQLEAMLGIDGVQT